MRTKFYIKKNGLFLKVETVVIESDYWEVSEIVEMHNTVYSWTDDIDEAKFFIEYSHAREYLVRNMKRDFFKDAEVS